MSEGIAKLLRAKDHFEVFSLPARFELDRQSLESRYIELARIAHPDFAGPDAWAQAQAVSLLARINEAYTTLSDDLSRAKYLLQLSGVEADNPRLPGDVMHRVFDLRERLSLAQSSEDDAAIAQIREEARRWSADIFAELGRRLDAGERTPELGQLVSGAKYVSRITTA